MDISTPPTHNPTQFALSPTGESIAFVALDSSTNATELYLRPLDSGTARPLPGTEGAQHPFWSPDSRWIGFFAAGQLYRIDTRLGGRPERLAAAANPGGGSWSQDDTILFAPNAVSPLYRVAASGGGEAVPATELAPGQSAHRSPFFLPSSRQYLFYGSGGEAGNGIFLGSLDGERAVRLTAAESAAVFVPPDQVLFVQGGDLVARQLDTARGELRGDPVVVVSRIRSAMEPDIGLSAAETGVLAYRPRLSTQVSWVSRDGELLGPGFGGTAELSSDERYVAYQAVIDGGSREVVVEDRQRGSSLQRFTVHPDTDGFPLWEQPESSRIAWHSDRNGTFDIWVKGFNEASAQEEILYGTPDAHEWPLDWSQDGEFLLYVSTDADYAQRDLWALPMRGANREPVPVATTDYEEGMGEFSPDVAWIAYQTDESGRFEIVLEKFPEADRRLPVSVGGGSEPRWSVDQSEIYFLAPDGTMMAAPVSFTDGLPEVETPVPLPLPPFAPSTFKMNYTVSRDGRFLGEIRPEVTQPIRVLLNWKP